MQDRLCRICGDGSVEDERHFLLACEEYQAERLQLWDELDRLVHDFGSIDGSAPSASSFSVSSLSDHERFTLVTGGYHSTIVDPQLRRCVMSVILIVVGRWMKKRQEAVDRYRLMTTV